MLTLKNLVQTICTNFKIDFTYFEYQYFSTMQQRVACDLVTRVIQTAISESAPATGVGAPKAEAQPQFASGSGYATPPQRRRDTFVGAFTEIQFQDFVNNLLKLALEETYLSDTLKCKYLISGIRSKFESVVLNSDPKIGVRVESLLDALLIPLEIVPNHGEFSIEQKFNKLLLTIDCFAPEFIPPQPNELVVVVPIRPDIQRYIADNIPHYNGEHVKLSQWLPYGSLTNIPNLMMVGDNFLISRAATKQILKKRKKSSLGMLKAFRRDEDAGRFSKADFTPDKRGTGPSPIKTMPKSPQQADAVAAASFSNTVLLHEQMTELAEFSSLKASTFPPLIYILMTHRNPCLIIFYILSYIFAMTGYRITKTVALSPADNYFLVNTHISSTTKAQIFQITLAIRVTEIMLLDNTTIEMTEMMAQEDNILFDIVITANINVETLKPESIVCQLKSTIYSHELRKIELNFKQQYANLFPQYIEHSKLLTAAYMFARHPTKHEYALPWNFLKDYREPAIKIKEIVEQINAVKNRKIAYSDETLLFDRWCAQAMRDVNSSLAINNKKVRGIESIDRFCALLAQNQIGSEELQSVIIICLIQGFFNPADCLYNQFIATLRRQIYDDCYGNQFRSRYKFMEMEQGVFAATRGLPQEVIAVTGNEGHYDEKCYYNIFLEADTIHYQMGVNITELLLHIPNIDDPVRLNSRDGKAFLEWKMEFLIPVNMELNLTLKQPQIKVDVFELMIATHKQAHAAATDLVLLICDVLPKLIQYENMVLIDSKVEYDLLQKIRLAQQGAFRATTA